MSTAASAVHRRTRITQRRRSDSRPGAGRRTEELDGRRLSASSRWMNELLVDTHAHQRATRSDRPAQGLHALGVGNDRIHVDHGLTGTNRDRPGLRLALAACRAGDTLLVTNPDRLARSLHDARDILGELTRRNVKLSFGGSIHNPTDLWEGLCSTCWRWWFSPNSAGWALE
jgi:hypothetical protein